MIKNLVEEINSGSKLALTKKKILSYYMTNRRTTNTDLAKDLDMSIPTINKFVSELCDDGLVVSFGKLETNEGRRPTLYGLKEDGCYFLGINIVRQGIEIGIINFVGDLENSQFIATDKIENTQASLDTLCNLINNYIASANIDTSRLIKVCITISGRVNSELGYSHSLFNFNERPLAEILSEKIGIPVCIENDTRAMAYGEYCLGNFQEHKTIIFLNISWGLGSGLIINGELFKGKSGFSGEIGHFPIFDNEELCHCGKRGCLETEVSGLAFQRRLIENINEGKTTILAEKYKSGNEITLADIIDAIRKEDLLCIEILEDIGQKLGRALAGLINYINPELVIIGGTLSTTGDYLLQPIKTAVRKYSLNIVSRDSKIIMSKLADKAGLLGACLTARDKMFD